MKLDDAHPCPTSNCPGKGTLVRRDYDSNVYTCRLCKRYYDMSERGPSPAAVTVAIVLAIVAYWLLTG